MFVFLLWFAQNNQVLSRTFIRLLWWNLEPQTKAILCFSLGKCSVCATSKSVILQTRHDWVSEMISTCIFTPLFPVFDPHHLPSRLVRRPWCWLWATAGWTWCRRCWNRELRSISRTMRAPRRWCARASTAMPRSWDYCWHSQTAMPPWVTVYVSHCLCEPGGFELSGWSNFVSHSVLHKQRIIITSSTYVRETKW